MATACPSGCLGRAPAPHESQLAEATLATVRVPQPRGRPRTRLKQLAADKAYDSRELRRQLRRWHQTDDPHVWASSAAQAETWAPDQDGERYRQR
jgi:hypothetical protein